MKKKLIIFNLILTTLLISGCGCSKKEETVVCKKSINFDTHDYNVKYVISYDSNNKMINYERDEEFDSDDSDLLTSTLEYKKELYSDLVELDGYEFDGVVENNKLTTKLTINFDIISSEKLFEIDSTYKVYYDTEKEQFDIDNYIKSWR